MRPPMAPPSAAKITIWSTDGITSDGLASGGIVPTPQKKSSKATLVLATIPTSACAPLRFSPSLANTASTIQAKISISSYFRRLCHSTSGGFLSATATWAGHSAWTRPAMSDDARLATRSATTVRRSPLSQKKDHIDKPSANRPKDHPEDRQRGRPFSSALASHPAANHSANRSASRPGKYPTGRVSRPNKPDKRHADRPDNHPDNKTDQAGDLCFFFVRGLT
jgi:hypothetical protein